MKNYLILSEEEEFHNKIEELIKKENKEVNIFRMYNTVEAIKFYELFKDNLDIVIIDDEMPNTEELKNNKFTLFIKKPINKDSFLNELLELKDKQEKEKEIKLYMKDIVNKKNKQKYEEVKENMAIMLFVKTPNIKNLTEAVEKIYIQSEQTQIHIKSIIKYCDFFGKKVADNIFNFYTKRKYLIDQLTNEKEKYTSDKINELLMKYEYYEKKYAKNLKAFFEHNFYDLLNLPYYQNHPERLKIKLKKSITNINLGGFFHDIGKNFIDIKLLDSNKKYTKTDINKMKNHTPYGYYFLEMFKDNINKEKIEYLQNVVNEHHTSPDEEINQYSKIVRFIDFFEALVALRSYKPMYNLEDAINKIKSINQNEQVIKTAEETTYHFNEIFFHNKNKFYQIYLDNILDNINYYNKALKKDFYKDIEKEKANHIILHSLNNLINNLTLFDNKFKNDCEYLKSLNLFKIVEKKNNNERDIYEKYDININTNIKIDLNKCQTFFKTFDTKLFEQYGINFFNKNNIKKEKEVNCCRIDNCTTVKDDWDSCP